MTRKILALTFAAAAFAVSPGVALAHPHPKPQHHATQQQAHDCKLKTIKLHGVLESDPGIGSTSFTMKVTKANKAGRHLVGTSVSITVGAGTHVARDGAAASVDKLTPGDTLKVKLRRCKGDLPLTATTVDDVAAVSVKARHG